MRKSDTRILTTHVGSLPRTPPLRDLLVRQERGAIIDEAALARQVEAAVAAAVRRQLEVGIDVGSDGEQPRVGFSTYVARRMRGFGGESRRPPARDVAEFPDYAAMLDARRRVGPKLANSPPAVSEVEYPGLGEDAGECELVLRSSDRPAARFVE